MRRVQSCFVFISEMCCQAGGGGESGGETGAADYQPAVVGVTVS